METIAATNPGDEAGVGRLATADLLAVGVYLVALVAVGAYFARRERATSDYFLAGRRVPWWAAGVSIFGTQLSAITFMAIPAKVYATDWAYILGHATIPLLAPLIVFVYLPYFRRGQITTAYEVLERRFGLGVRLYASAVFVLFQLGRLSIVLLLPAIAVSAVTGFDVVVCILVMGVLCTVYTVLGGIEAVVWTDVMQVVVLLGGAVLSLGIIVASVDGGLSELLVAARAEGKLRVAHWTWDPTVASVWVVLVGNAFITLGSYTADQVVIQRYLTTADERQAARAIWINALLIIPSAVVFFGLGTTLWVYYRANPALLDPAMEQGDRIFPWFIVTQLPVGMSGLVIAGLLAAAMSTLDSSLNSMATAIVTDFYRRLRPIASDRRCLRLARVLTVILGGFGTGTALYMARFDIPSLWDLFSKVVGFLGGGLTGLFVLAVFTRRTTGYGALVGAIVSAGVVSVVAMLTSVHFFLYPAIGVVTCVVVGYGVSVVRRGETHALG